MVRRGARRRQALGLIAALLVNAALLVSMGRGALNTAWPTAADTGIAVRVELTRPAPERFEREPATSAAERLPTRARRSPQPSIETPTSASARPPAPAAPPQQAALPSLLSDRGAKAGGVQASGDADLRAKTAFALRKLGACSRMNSGTGDAQDRELCTRDFAAADGATIDTVPIGKRADYDAAHAKAGYLVPADAANPNFVTSQFKRGGTVWSLHAGCGLVHGKWQCGVH